MAAYNKFDIFVEHVVDQGTHLLFTAGGDQLNVYLSNTAPVATNQLKADIAEIAAGNGYPAGGLDTQNSAARAAGLVTLTGTKAVITASGGTIGPFQYVIMYNLDTPIFAEPLISWWDNGGPITLDPGDSFAVKFNGGDPTGTLFTFV